MQTEQIDIRIAHAGTRHEHLLNDCMLFDISRVEVSRCYGLRPSTKGRSALKCVSAYDTRAASEAAR